MAPALILIIRAVQAFLAILVLGLIAAVVNFFNEVRGNSDACNFLLFCSIWSLLALAYLVGGVIMTSRPQWFHAYAVLAVEAVTMIFWFAGFIAVADFVRLLFNCIGSICGAAKAAAAFGAFSWVAWCASLFLAVRAYMANRNAGVEAAVDLENKA